MQILRTPDDRLADLPRFPYSPHYLESLHGAGGCRVHNVDEGPADADATWLCLHGERLCPHGERLCPHGERLCLLGERLCLLGEQSTGTWMFCSY